ncbi:MAG: hypothetical protein JW950_00530 [Deltaproteobacteria bacterium]|nr:hypothetical protein [Deltaproteobacteria bacterium]
MEVQQDFRDLLESFNKNAVEFIIVGAYALGFHGAPRYTGNLNVFVRPDAVNAGNILQVLHEFGFGATGLTPADFQEEGRVVQLGVPPVRIDIITSLTGVSWEQARSGRVEGWFGDVKVHYIGRKDFISNKRALGRKKALADLEAVGAE